MILDNWLMIMDILLIFGDVERKHKKRGIILWARRLVVERTHFWLNIFRQLIYFEKKRRFLAIPYFYTVTIAQTIIEK